MFSSTCCMGAAVECGDAGTLDAADILSMLRTSVDGCGL